MSDNLIEPVRQETEAERSSEAATKVPPRVPVVSILLLTTLLGCLAPYLVVKIQENSYQKIFSLPEKATEILTGDYEGLYARTAAGRVFFCDVNIESSHCKEIASENVPMAPTTQPEKERCLRRSSPPPAPGKVIASYEDCAQFADSFSQTDWVILDDGSVWIWKLNCGWFGCSYDPGLQMLLGAVFGCLVGEIIVVTMRRRARRQSWLSKTKISYASYIQALGGAMVFVGSFMPWVTGVTITFLIRGIRISETQNFDGLPVFFGGPLILLTAIFTSRAPGAHGSRLAALLGFLAFLYVGAYALVVVGSNGSVGAGVWVCLLGSVLAVAGGMMKNPGATPQPPPSTPQVKVSDAPREKGETE